MNGERIAELRTLEVQCYSVCLYLLREQQSAALAAQAALTDVYRDAGFWFLTAGEREKRISCIAARKALQVKPIKKDSSE